MICTENPLYETLFDANCPDIRFGDISYLVIMGRDSIEPNNPSDALEWATILDKAILRGNGQFPAGTPIEVETYHDDNAMLKMDREIEFVISDLNDVNYRFLQQFCAGKNIKAYFGNDEDLYRVGNARITNADIYSAGEFMEGKITIKYSINCSESILHDRYENNLSNIVNISEWTTNVLSHAMNNSIDLPTDVRDIRKLNSFLTDLSEEFVEDYRPNFLFYGEYISATPAFRLINLAEHTIYSTATSYPTATGVGGLTYDNLGFKGNGVDARIGTTYDPTLDYGSGWNKTNENLGAGVMVNKYDMGVSGGSRIALFWQGGATGSYFALFESSTISLQVRHSGFGRDVTLNTFDKSHPYLILAENYADKANLVSDGGNRSVNDTPSAIVSGNFDFLALGPNYTSTAQVGVMFNYLTTTTFDYNKMRDAILNARNI